MKTRKTMNKTITKILAALTLPVLLTALLLTTTKNAAAQEPHIKNVVLVHGAFADGSGWRALFDVLTKKVTTLQSFKIR